jgi:hypothetical protein
VSNSVLLQGDYLIRISKERKWDGKENGTGVISLNYPPSHLYFYDFSLTPDEISAHHQRAIRGEPYFEPQSGPLTPERWLAITLVSAGTSQVFDTLTGLAIP